MKHEKSGYWAALERVKECERAVARASIRLTTAIMAHPGTRAALEAEETARQNMKAALLALTVHDEEHASARLLAPSDGSSRGPCQRPALRIVKGGAPCTR